MRYSVNLGCPCPGTLGWTVEIEADSAQQAVDLAVIDSTTCAGCGTVHGECDGCRASREGRSAKIESARAAIAAAEGVTT